MELSINEMKLRFENINLDEIPEHIRFELETIQEETDDFQDEDAREIFAKELKYLYAAVQKKFPTALKDYVPPQPSPEEVEAEMNKKAFGGFISAGDEKLAAKDFVGALENYRNALNLNIDNESVRRKIENAEAEIAKQDKIAKA